jgi:phage baseplate assembly protein gpV
MIPVLTAAVVTGCKHEPQAAREINPVGSYALVSVDGNNVPCTVQHEAAKLTVKSGSLTIKADGTCSSKIVVTPPSGTEAAREVKATFTRAGTKLSMRWEGAGNTVGTVEGDTFTMNNEGMIFAYRK